MTSSVAPSSAASDQGRDAATATATLGNPLYLMLEAGEVFGHIHLPRDRDAREVGVVVCPPFGWDELTAYRSLRAWSDALAREGYPVLRFDLPGTGDSAGGPHDPNRLDAWTTAAGAAGAFLRETYACRRVVGLGLGLGCVIAGRAVALEAPIDDLILWSAFARGHTLLHELRTVALGVLALGSDGRGPAADALSVAGGAADLAGFLLSAQTVRELEQLDLAALPVPAAPSRRVLLFGRDELVPDRRLREHYERSGASVTTADGTGYAAMMTESQTSRVPGEAIAHSLRWLADARPGLERGHRGYSATRVDAIELRSDGAAVRERPFDFEHAGQRLRGVLCEPIGVPAAQACAVLLNTGADRRIGVGRISVDAARRWAARGVPTLRFDAIGVGDSDGGEGLYAASWDSMHVTALADQVPSALDALQAGGLPGRFVIGGMCAGAYWSLHAALKDERVCGLMLVNLLAFQLTDRVFAAAQAREHWHRVRERSPRELLARLLSDPHVGARMLAGGMRTAITPLGLRVERTRRQVAKILDSLRDRRVQTMIVLGHGEPLLDTLRASGILQRLDRWPDLRLCVLPGDHLFSSSSQQRLLLAELGDSLTDMVERAGA